MALIRLQKYFTDCGVMSRRAAEEEIKSGKVTVNGHIAELGERIDPKTDEVIWRGKAIKPTNNEKICIMLNKPRGIVCTASDEKGRRNVTDLCRDVKDASGKPTRLYPIGRLDMDSDGLLLLTNDGELANKLTHPRHSVPKNTPEIKETVELFPFSFAPVKEGEIMGRLLYSCDGEKVAEIPIYATYTVEKANYKTNLWEKIRTLFKK